MAKYVLDPTKAHEQSLIELINNDNAETIGQPLNLQGYAFKAERKVNKETETGITRDYAITIYNKIVPKDACEVFWNKIALTDAVPMSYAAGNFDWYADEVWADETSLPKAIASFNTAATAAGINVANAVGDVTVVRNHDEGTGLYSLEFSCDSRVFATGAIYALPKRFADLLTKQNLDGFIYEPIKPEDVAMNLYTKHAQG